jgi:hypothetical protein
MRIKNFIYILLIPILLLTGCSFDEPVMPRWTTPFILPIIKETFVLAEELSQDSSFVIRGDSIFLELSGKFDGDMLSSSDLSIDGKDSTADFTLNRIELDSLNSISTGDIAITDILPNLSNFIGMTVPFPDTTITTQAVITDTNAFTSMKVTNGELVVMIYNDLPFTLAPENPSGNSIQISIFNDFTGEHISDLMINDTVAPGEVAQGTAPLGSGDGWIRIPLRLDYTFHVLAENIFVTQDSLDAWKLRIDLLFQNLELEEINGKVTPQTLVDTFRIGVEIEDQIIEAVIDSGTIQIRFFNSLPLEAHLAYTIPDLISVTNGLPFSGQLTVAANDSMTQVPVNLQGYRISNSANPGQPIDTLSVLTQTTTDSGRVTLRADDRITVRVITSKIIFSYIEGILSPDTLNLEPFIVTDIVDYNGLGSGIQIQGAFLLLELVNQIDIQNFELEGVVTGYKKDEFDQYIDSSKVDIPLQTLAVGSNIISLSGPEVDALVNIYPSDLKAEGIIFYSGQAMVSAGDTIGGSYTFSTPFRLQILNADPITLEPDTIREIDDNFQSGVSDSLIKNAKLTAKIVNFSPVSGMIDIFLSADPNRQDLYDTTGYSNPELEWYKTIPIPQAPVNPATGFVTNPVEIDFIIELSFQELQIFTKPPGRPIRAGIKNHLDDTNGFVNVRGSDYFQLSGFIDTQIIFKETE